MASADSQRQIVVPLIPATRPWASTSRRSSRCDHWASGRPQRAGSSQARALTATTTSGGKAGWPAAPGGRGAPRQAPQAEALAPLAEDLPWEIQAARDNVIAQARRSQADD